MRIVLTANGRAGTSMRLIDKDELLTAFPVDNEPMLTKSCVRMTIQRMPAVDAVPVVRCKNCIHWGKFPVSTVLPQYHKCGMATYKSTKGDDFCSDGKESDNG